MFDIFVGFLYFNLIIMNIIKLLAREKRILGKQEESTKPFFSKNLYHTSPFKYNKITFYLIFFNFFIWFRNTSEGTNGEEKKAKSAPSTSTNPKPLSQSPTELLQDSSSESVTTNDVDRPARSVNDKAHVVSILPGLGFYTNSSDSDTSSSDSEVDLLNSVIHRAVKKKSCHSS